MKITPPPSTPRDPVQPEPPAMRAPGTDNHGVGQQLGRLFGESLFGAWPDSHRAITPSHRPRRGRIFRRLGVVLVLGLLTASGLWWQRRGDGPRVDPGRSQLAGAVAPLLAEGALDRVAETLAKLLPAGKPLTAGDPHLEIIVSAEAALYRYQDAAPERLARIAGFLSNEGGTPARLLARLTVASRPERVAAYDALAKLPASHAQGSEYHALMASINEERGDLPAARASWERSQTAGPRWLPHRYLQGAFEARQHNPEAAARIAAHMAQVAPDSPWTRMARQHFASPPAPGGLPAAPPVARHYAELAPVFQNLAAQNLAAARQALGRALGVVNDQAPFVLDVFKGLRDAKANALAMELTSYEAWPRSNPWARGALSDLEASLADNRDAPEADARPGSQPKTTKAGGKKQSAKKAMVTGKKAGKGKTRRGRP